MPELIHFFVNFFYFKGIFLLSFVKNVLTNFKFFKTNLETLRRISINKLPKQCVNNSKKSFFFQTRKSIFAKRN